MRPRVKVQQFVHTCQQHDPSQCHSHVRVLLHLCLQRAVPSIPSKFETTLHVGQRERNAFGTRTHRFNPSDVCTQYAHLHTRTHGSSNTFLPAERAARAWQLLQANHICQERRNMWLSLETWLWCRLCVQGGSSGWVRTRKSGAKLSPAAPQYTQTKRFGEQERRHLQAHLDPAPGQYSAPAYVHSSLCCVCHTPPTKHSPQLWLLRQQTRIWATKSFSTAPTTGLFAKPRRVNESRAPTH